MSYAIDLRCEVKPQQDGTCIVTVDVTGIPSISEAVKISKWLRRSLRENVAEIGRMDVANRPASG